jgi:hypothetical protein
MSSIVCHRIVGFEELGNTDAFQTATLELRLQTNGAPFSLRPLLD